MQSPQGTVQLALVGLVLLVSCGSGNGELVRALERAGFIVLRQSGSHVTLRHSVDLARRATVPRQQNRQTWNPRNDSQGRRCVEVEQLKDLI